MTELYSRLKQSGNYSDAYLVLKNELNKNIDDIETFEEFILINSELSRIGLIDFEERKRYLAEADSALAMFSDMATIDDAALDLIKATKIKLAENYKKICDDELEFYNSKQEEVREENTKILNELLSISDRLLKSESQEDFNNILSEIPKLEEELQKDSFSEEQKNTYDVLTREYSNIISSKMEELNRKSLLEYNKNAVKQLKEVFDTFTNNKNHYKKIESNLKNLLVSKLFVYDTSNLFNETLIYYNHIYNLIFQEIDDDLKFKMTEWALSTTKRVK